MVTFNTVFLVGITAIIILVVALYFKIYILGLFGSMLMVLLGLYSLNTQLDNVDMILNNVYGIIMVGIGCYFFVVGSLEKIDFDGAESGSD
jgi:hypothetical protein